MNFVVQSRFACLNSDDDEVGTKKTQKSSSKENTNIKNKKDKKNNCTNMKQQNNTSKKQKSGKGAKIQQWEEWKQKDETIVAGKFEQDLENAMTLSKIDFEKNKDKYLAREQLKGKKSEKKKSTKKTISLDEFLTGDTIRATETNGAHITEKELSKRDFFNKISEEAKTALNKEKLNEKFLQRQNAVDDVITIAQYEEKLCNEQLKNKELTSELEKSKKEIISVKERNKTLYTLLSTGEMKGKAEIINELEKLTVIKDELTHEVTRLHGLLEQERSKVAALTNDKLHKKGGKKHM